MHKAPLYGIFLYSTIRFSYVPALNKYREYRGCCSFSYGDSSKSVNLTKRPKAAYTRIIWLGPPAGKEDFKALKKNMYKEDFKAPYCICVFYTIEFFFEYQEAGFSKNYREGPPCIESS